MNTERSLERIADSLKDIAAELKALRKMNDGVFHPVTTFVEVNATDDNLDGLAMAQEEKSEAGND